MNAELPATHADHTISDLLSEIARMRTLIVYYENQIMRKEIAVQEIIKGHQSKSITEKEINAESKNAQFV